VSVGSRRLFLKMAGALLGAVVMPAESRGQGALERRIPRTGEALPAVGLGTWQVFDVAGDSKELAQAKETLRVFVDGGGRMVDSSPMYGSSEQVTGQLAVDLGARPKLFVATKVWTSGRQAGIRQMEDSMRKLGVELSVHEGFVAAGTAIVGLLMVTAIPYRNFKEIDLRHSYGTMVAMVFAIALVIVQWRVTLFVIFVAYCFSGPVEWLWRRRTGRVLERSEPKPQPAEHGGQT